MISIKQYKHIMKLARLKRKPLRKCNCGKIIKTFYAKRCRKCWKIFQQNLMLKNWKNKIFREKRIKSDIGHIMTKTTKERISQSNLGKKAWNKNIEFKHRGSYKKGHKVNKQLIEKLRKLNTGKKRNNITVRHHLDCNPKNNHTANHLYLSHLKHNKLHSNAYRFIAEMNLIKKYLEWFDKKYNLEAKKCP